MVDLDGGPLTLQVVEAVARRGEQVSLAPGAEQALRAGRAFVDRLAAGAEPIYGITTGVGKLKDVVIPSGERADLQRNLVLSHAGGVGAPLAEADVRAIMLLLAASLARGASGVRPTVVETVIACLNRRVHPVVPELGTGPSRSSMQRASRAWPTSRAPCRSKRSWDRTPHSIRGSTRSDPIRASSRPPPTWFASRRRAGSSPRTATARASRTPTAFAACRRCTARRARRSRSHGR